MTDSTNVEVSWFRRVSGGFSAIVNGTSVCFEPTDSALMAWADGLSDEQAEACLIKIWAESLPE